MRPSAILIDAIGLGELGLPVRAINVSEAAATRENCMRLRDELWFKGREWFQERLGSIPQDDALLPVQQSAPKAERSPTVLSIRSGSSLHAERPGQLIGISIGDGSGY